MQLIVDGAPYLMLAGEVGNSSASASHVLGSLWSKLQEMRLNTLLVPVYWELIEPSEGRFDFSSLDVALAGASGHGLKLVLLWFGSYKNGMSSYVPAWVKRDFERFPRARLASGEPMEVLSAFAESNLQADALAFAQLSAYLRDHERRHTVILVQVENEVAMVEQAREHGPLADAAFSSPVPETLLEALRTERFGADELAVQAWRARGAPRAGTWSEVFGSDHGGEELFMAWHYARYVDRVALAGKAEYALPMFTNAALNAPGKLPGEYPSAGPLPHLFGLWRLAAPHLDFLSPDIYFDEFDTWCRRYDRSDNALFIPEARLGEEAAVHALYAVGEHRALGFSPFSIESEAAGAPLARVYAGLGPLAPEILKHQQNRGSYGPTLRGVLLDAERLSVQLSVGAIEVHIEHEFTWQWSRGYGEPHKPRVGGLLLARSEDELLIFGLGLLVTFPPRASSEHVGIESVDVGRLMGEEWVFDHRLNGDQTHQGRHVHLPVGAPSLLRVRLYRYR